MLITVIVAIAAVAAGAGAIITGERRQEETMQPLPVRVDQRNRRQR